MIRPVSLLEQTYPLPRGGSDCLTLSVKAMILKIDSCRQSAVLLFLLTATLAGCSRNHPSDQAMTSEFQSHKAQFQQLLEMFQTDKDLGRVAYDFTRPAEPEKLGITQERLKQYRALFTELKLSAGIEGYPPKDSVMFIRSTQGLSVSGSSKGFAFLLKQPELLVNDLDEYKAKQQRSFTAFRHIEGNWYLYYDFED
jgi:hypothetical protein